MLPIPLLVSAVFSRMVLTCGILAIHYYPGTLGSKNEMQKGSGDFTLDMHGWRELETRFFRIKTTDESTGRMKKEAVILSNKWFPAAHLEYYVAKPLKMQLIATGRVEDIHHYNWINKERSPLSYGDDAYCIVPSNNYIDAAAVYSSLFSTFTDPEIIDETRNGKICRRFYLWRFRNYKLH